MKKLKNLSEWLPYVFVLIAAILFTLFLNHLNK
jgi:hypothetical protein